MDADVTLAPVSLTAARFAVEHWHYSGRMPVSKPVAYGVWEAGRFIGAIIFGQGAGSATDGRRWGLREKWDIAELVRVALRTHRTPVTQLVAEAVRQVKASNPGLRMIVSFADPRHGHLGRIYQAGNWIYLGRTPPTPVYLDRFGKEWHNRQVSESGFRKQWWQNKRVPKYSETTKIITPGKFRYALPLDKQMRRRLEPLAQPYPQELADEGSIVSRPGSAGEVQVQPLASARGA